MSHDTSEDCIATAIAPDATLKPATVIPASEPESRKENPYNWMPDQVRHDEVWGGSVLWIRFTG